MNSFYTEYELRHIGLSSFGEDVKISRFATIYNPGRISVGHHSRIDDFSVLSCSGTGTLLLGEYVHISTHCLIVAMDTVVFNDFSGISSGCRIFGGSDDYSGEYLTNPCVPALYRRCEKGPVILGRHAVVGAGSIIMHGVTIGDFSAVGAMSMVVRDVPSGQIHAGVPARFIKDRKNNLLDVEKELRSGEKQGLL